MYSASFKKDQVLLRARQSMPVENNITNNYNYNNTNVHRCSAARLADLVKIAVHMWLGPYLPNIPRPVKPVRPTGFLKGND